MLARLVFAKRRWMGVSSMIGHVSWPLLLPNPSNKWVLHSWGRIRVSPSSMDQVAARGEVGGSPVQEGEECPTLKWEGMVEEVMVVERKCPWEGGAEVLVGSVGEALAEEEGEGTSVAEEAVHTLAKVLQARWVVRVA